MVVSARVVPIGAALPGPEGLFEQPEATIMTRRPTAVARTGERAGERLMVRSRPPDAGENSH
jgi:hypothetical protein